MSSYEFPKPLDYELNCAESGYAIVCDGDTAPKAISSGQYLFIKNHSTLATGGYHATAAIASGADLTSSNTAPDADGIANAINSNLATIDTNLKTYVDWTSSLVFNESLTDKTYTHCYSNTATGLVFLQVYFTAVADVAESTALIGGLPAIKNTSGNFILWDYTGTAKACYIDPNATLKVRGGITSGHTYFGTIMYIRAVI